MEIENKILYKDYTEKNSVPFFLQSWWLDIVTEKKWNVVVSRKKETVKGFLPYVVSEKIRFSAITQPLLTQFMGPVLIYPAKQKYSKKLGFEKDVIQDLYKNLPKVAFIKQVWNYQQSNWLPLYWLNYKQTTKFSYCIDDISNPETIFNDFETKIRGDIRKSEKVVTVKDSSNPEILYNLVNKTFSRKNLKMASSFELIEKIVLESTKRNQGKMFYAEDTDKNIHAAVFIVWDDTTAYYLLGGGDSDYRNSGATSLLLWTAIKEVSSKVNRFDFEGSMIENVERFVRGFGAEQIQLNSISKINSKRYFIIDKLNEFKKMLF